MEILREDEAVAGDVEEDADHPGDVADGEGLPEGADVVAGDLVGDDEEGDHQEDDDDLGGVGEDGGDGGDALEDEDDAELDAGAEDGDVGVGAGGVQEGGLESELDR